MRGGIYGDCLRLVPELFLFLDGSDTGDTKLKKRGKRVIDMMSKEQQGKDVFEYSVFGSPQQKIGDFTQSKLARWSA